MYIVYEDLGIFRCYLDFSDNIYETLATTILPINVSQFMKIVTEQSNKTKSKVVTLQYVQKINIKMDNLNWGNMDYPFIRVSPHNDKLVMK